MLDNARRRLGKVGLFGVGAMLISGAYQIASTLYPVTNYAFITPPVARWLFWITIVIGIAGLLMVGVALIRSEQNKEETNSIQRQYVNKIIVDAKAPSILAIPDTLKELSNIEATTTSQILSKKRHVKVNKLAKMQKELQRELNIKPNYKYSAMEDVKQRELVMKAIKKLGISEKEFNEEYLRALLAFTWILDKNELGLESELEKNDLYLAQKEQLDKQMPKLSGKEAGYAISTYKNMSLGLNSIILFQSYFPQNYKRLLPVLDKPASQMKHEREEILEALLIMTRNALESELK